MFKLWFLGACGICFGILTAAGVFTVLSAVALIPRLIGKTHSAKHIMLYENMIVLGTMVGGVFSVFADLVRIGDFALEVLHIPEKIWSGAVNVFLTVAGLGSGVLTGCLALAIAEMLDSIPIFTRRVAFRHGLGIVILCMAAAKVLGSLFYFYNIYSG